MLANKQVGPKAWQAKAKDYNEATGAQFTIVGGVVFGCIAAAAITPITGALVAAFFAQKAWQDTQRANRNEVAIADGCIAHVLRGHDFTGYLREVGAAEVLEQLTWAIDNGFPLSAEAEEFLEIRAPKLLPEVQVTIDIPATATPSVTQATTESPATAPTVLETELEPELPETETPTPPQAPDLTSGTTAEKINRLLEALARDGFPIRRLIKHPFLWAYGQSQSGKSTIINLVSAIRLGLGYRVSCASLDDDVPPLQWDTLALSDEAYVEFIPHLAELIHSAPKGSLENESCTIDEFFKGAQLLNMNPLISQIIGKGPKTKIKVSIISQLDTLKPHGLEGLRDAIDMARVLISPIRAEDSHGEPFPTGRYCVTFPGEPAQEWVLPAWMLTDKNQYGQPDPVQWLLNRIPELCQRSQPASPAPAADPQSQTDIRQQLEFCLEKSPVATLSADLSALHQWASKQSSPVTARQVQQAKLPALQGYSADKIRECFIALNHYGKGTINGVGAEMSYAAKP